MLENDEVPEGLTECLLTRCWSVNSAEKFASFFAVDHETMSGISADEPFQRIILEVVCVFIQPLAILKCNPRSTLHLAKPDRINLPDQRRGNARSHGRREFGAKAGRESQVPRPHHDPMERILCLECHGLDGLHDVQARTALLQLRTFPDLNIQGAKFAEVADNQLVRGDGNERSRALAEAGYDQSHMLVVMPQTTSGSVAAIRIPAVSRQKHCAGVVLALRLKQLRKPVKQATVDGVANQ